MMGCGSVTMTDREAVTMVSAATMIDERLPSYKVRDPPA